PIAWFCISLLIVTGLFQMSVNPHYDGFLSTSTQWSLSLLIKHGLVLVMIVVTAVQTWEILPAIRRALMIKNKISPEQLVKLQKRETWLLRANLALAVLILLATAFARAA
ncbi:MAG: CopD family protein, partial [Chloroflexi bacterium]|nr:CopD family protein [Chloroflexota bacterium]